MRGVRHLVVFVDFAVLFGLLAWADYHGGAVGHGFRLTSGVLMAVFVFLIWPYFRPIRRPGLDRGRVRLGYTLIGTAWAAAIVVAGAAGYYVAADLHDRGFHGRIVFFAAAGWLLALLRMYGRHLAATVPVDWSPFRRPRLLQTLLNLVVGAVVAGYAVPLSRFAITATTWVPVHTFLGLRGWWGSNWAAALGCAVLAPFWLLALGIAQSLAQHIAALVLGKENAVEHWIGRSMPVRFIIDGTGFSFAAEVPPYVRIRYGYSETVTYPATAGGPLPRGADVDYVMHLLHDVRPPYGY